VYVFALVRVTKSGLGSQLFLFWFLSVFIMTQKMVFWGRRWWRGDGASALSAVCSNGG